MIGGISDEDTVCGMNIKRAVICGCIIVGILWGNPVYARWLRWEDANQPASQTENTQKVPLPKDPKERAAQYLQFDERYEEVKEYFFRHADDFAELEKYFIAQDEEKIKHIQFTTMGQFVRYHTKALNPRELAFIEAIGSRLLNDQEIQEFFSTKLFISGEIAPGKEDGIFIKIGYRSSERSCYEAITYNPYRYTIFDYIMGYQFVLEREIAPQWYFTQIVFDAPRGFGVLDNEPKSALVAEQVEQIERADLSQKAVKKFFRENRQAFAELAKILAENSEEKDFYYKRNFNYYHEEMKKTYAIYNHMSFDRDKKTKQEIRQANKVACYQAAEKFMNLLAEQRMAPGKSATIKYHYDKYKGGYVNIELRDTYGDEKTIYSVSGQKDSGERDAPWETPWAYKVEVVADKR